MVPNPSRSANLGNCCASIASLPARQDQADQKGNCQRLDRCLARCCTYPVAPCRTPGDLLGEVPGHAADRIHCASDPLFGAFGSGGIFTFHERSNARTAAQVPQTMDAACLAPIALLAIGRLAMNQTRPAPRQTERRPGGRAGGRGHAPATRHWGVQSFDFGPLV